MTPSETWRALSLIWKEGIRGHVYEASVRADQARTFALHDPPLTV
jgi:hypothetical protein